MRALPPIMLKTTETAHYAAPQFRILFLGCTISPTSEGISPPSSLQLRIMDASNNTSIFGVPRVSVEDLT